MQLFFMNSDKILSCLWCSLAVLGFDGDIFSDVTFDPACMFYMVVLKMRN